MTDPPAVSAHDIASAFSGRRFSEAYEGLSGHVRWLAIAMTLTLASCGATATPAPATTGPGASATDAPGEAPSLAATPTTHPGEGVPDPDGRIAFGRITRQDPLFGQVIAIWAVDPDGSDLVQLNDGESGFPAWSPDGSRLAFTQHQDDDTWQIATMAADGSDVRVLTDGPGADGASWSPDGSWIAHMRGSGDVDDPDFHTSLYRMDADGSNATLVGDPDTFDVEPRISPDGMAVLFERLTFPNGQQRQEVIVRVIETGEERVVLDAAAGGEHAHWSPDGQWIIYNTSPAYGSGLPNDQVERIAADGSGEPVVLFEATASQGGFKPWYSPDGSRIVFGCSQGGDSSSDALCLMDHDGSNLVILVNSGAHENHFSWAPPTP